MQPCPLVIGIENVYNRAHLMALVVSSHVSIFFKAECDTFVVLSIEVHETTVFSYTNQGVAFAAFSKN